MLLVLTLGVACGRREQASPAETIQAQSRPEAVEASDVASRTPRAAGGRAPVLWIGLDGLDWELLDRLAAQGSMLNWKKLAGEGFSASLESFYPLISPILWTTIHPPQPGPSTRRPLQEISVDPL